jgi:hypothetical protein
MEEASMVCRKIGCVAAIVLFSTLSMQCHDLARGLDEYCPADPTTDGCDEGACLEFPCIAYCLVNVPELSGAPASGMGAWCDDLGDDFDAAGFCREHPELDACATWCAGHDGACDCGDGACEESETFLTCPDDCPASCGDGACNNEETPVSCQADCPPACPDGYCSHDETASSCAGDCLPLCGDDACTHDEDAAACPDDCPASCGDDECSLGETPATCPRDCPAVCGDDACTHDESAVACPDDCPAVCGDGALTHDEQCETDGECTTTCDTTGLLTCDRCMWNEVCEPPAELCNGVDDDCVGGVDDGFPCALGSEQPCTTTCDTTGTSTCGETCAWSSCAPPAEACNGFDDDCDGEVDEGCPCQTGWDTMATPATYLNDIHGTAWNDIFAVGDSGQIVHYDGASWAAMASGTDESLESVWARAADDVYAVGSAGTILHYDGADWSSEASHVTDDLNGVWGRAGGTVFAVGNNGRIVVNDHGDWVADVSGTTNALRAVHGTATAVRAVGDGPTIVYRLGLEWRSMEPNTTEHLADVWVGPATGGTYAVGTNGVLLSYCVIGTTFTWVETPSCATSDLTSVFGSGDTVLAVGGTGTIIRKVGSEWDLMSSGTTSSFSGVWLSSESDAYVLVHVDGEVLHRCGTGW